MKIGILTLPLETNYGGNLQAFAMQRVLTKMGHEVLTIDRHKRKEYPSIIAHIGGYGKRLFQHFILRKKKVSVKWNPFISEDDFKIAAEETQQFIERNIKLTKRVYSDQLKDIDKEYLFDAYVVGSDQVWLDYYCPNSFLDFVDRHGVKRVFYAASCGRQSFFNDSRKVSICRRLVKSFNGVSVRESSLVAPCKEKLGVEACWVLDPTMLLDSNEYLEATNCEVCSDPIVFSYILDVDNEKTAIVEAISKKENLPIVNGNLTDKNTLMAYPSVDNWVHNMDRARFVVTDSFHGTVFAILFHKPFITIGNSKRGLSRFLSLLGLLDLNDRLVCNLNLDRVLDIVDTPIDFERVSNIIERERNKSLSFIQNSLK